MGYNKRTSDLSTRLECLPHFQTADNLKNEKFRYFGLNNHDPDKRVSGCQQLFDSSIAAAMFASPWDEQTVLTACTQEFADSLSKFSFNSTSRFFD
jgi:hypothetical protein